MLRQVDIRMPAEAESRPLRQLGKRLLLGILMLSVIAGGVIADHEGYADGADDAVSVLDAFYYATVSITTTGYGDIVPVTDQARLFTTLVVTPARMIFLVLLVGTSVELITSASRSLIRERNWRRRVQDHVVICGFGVKGRTAMDSLLEQGEAPAGIVVIDPGEDELTAAGRVGCVAIHGDAASNEVLQAARVERARVVIVTPDRDDAAVLVTLSVRDLNPDVRIVAAARELENAPLLRRSGADVVLTSSGATGRMLGRAANTPHYVHVFEELLEAGSGLDLVERTITPEQAGKLMDLGRRGELVIAVFREDEVVARTPGGDFELLPGDAVVSVTAPG